MAWWDDALDAVGAVVGAVGDAVETVVDAVVDTVEEVVDTATDWANAGLDRARDAIAAFSPALGAVANLVLGLVKGVVNVVKDIVRIVLDVVRHVGEFVNALLHLNLARMIDALLAIVVNVGEIVVWAVRIVTGGYFAGPVSDYYMRDRHINMIAGMVRAEFGKQEAEDILAKLGFGTAHFRLPIRCNVRVMVADSSTFPFVALHTAGTLDLFALAGLLSFNSFPLFNARTRMVMVDASGADMWWRPVTRPDIKAFISSGGTSARFRCYAVEPYAQGRAMRTAHNKFKKLCIDLDFDRSFNFPTWQTYPTQPCNTPGDFTIAGATAWFAANTTRDSSEGQDARPLSITCFNISGGFRGIVAGRSIRRFVDERNGCRHDSTADACITLVDRSDDDTDGNAGPGGSGVLWRDAYPPWFGRYVMGHELGHYFGLAHAGHDGVENIMFSGPEGNAIVGGGSWRLWSHGEPVFVDADVEHAWRFIVKKLPHVLRAL
ncbi:MAG: hypothetical protein IPJ76_02470 [Flavobacteriales bacterium]|nr:MAG: hypothetical protein IPJ76_02470 [Flavobacteriales bacterium]